MKIRIEFHGEEKDFHEINEQIAGILEFPPFNIVQIGQGGNKQKKKWWIEFSNDMNN